MNRRWLGVLIAFAFCLVSFGQQGEGAAQGVVAPVLVKQVQPKYPHRLLHKPPTGTCTVSLKVDQQGLPEDVAMKESSGSEQLDESAVNAVRQYRFKPATRDGRPIMVEMAIVVKFQIR